jgi:site-specific recombinase XerD
MKTNIFLALDNRRLKADGTCAILLRIVHHRASSQITLGHYIKEKDWDAKNRVIRSSYKGSESVGRLNNLLRKKRAEAMDLIIKLDEAKKLDSYSVHQLKELIEQSADKVSFFKFTETIIQNLIEANRIGNARAYQSTLGVLKTYCNGKDLSFQELNYAFLTKFETAHLKKGNAHNGFAVYMRTVRAIFNIAIKTGKVDKELYPFTNFQIKTTKTRKRAISIEAIQRIEKLKLDSSHPLYQARNYFLVSFYLRGMSFADLAQLKLSNIIDDRIFYQRKKTDKPYNVKLTKEIQKIMNLYLVNKEPEDYIFPIIKRVSLQEQYKDVQWARKRFNKKLKDLAVLCKIPEHITSYVSRHSFATRAKNLGIPIASISDMLGHENIKTTEVYLDTLPSDILDKYHSQIIKKKKTT